MSPAPAPAPAPTKPAPPLSGRPQSSLRPQRARGVAVHPAALAAEDGPPQHQRRPQEPPGPRRLARPAMLVEEADEGADVLVEQAPAVGGAADVHDLGLGQEPRLPARPVEAVQPVGLLPEHEERFVEEADGAGRVPADEETRTHRPLDLACLAVVEPAR